ncbi:MAG TPA: serine/threonine-protein kinase [Anaerolineae bacterium]|nr:serine/threonine-protein kinase [Anaerolineae bacterium]
MTSEERILAAGTILEDRYRLLSEGISWDLGTAYDAYDTLRDHQVLLLVLSPQWGSAADALSRLQELQQIVTRVGPPELIPFEHAGIVGGRLYVVRVPGEDQTLADLLAEHQRLDLGLAVETTICLCEALAPAHRTGLVHGSLSPHSVMVRQTASTVGVSGSTVTVVDFGLLPALRSTDSPQGRPWGRMPYLSPEQARGAQLHPPSDVYVIGCMLYEMLTGRPPFQADDATVLALQHLRQEPPSLEILVPDAPAVLVQIMHTALAKEPAARYRNAGQLAHVLKSQVASSLSSRQPEPLADYQVPVPQRVVVPPPPAPPVAEGWSSTDIYALEGPVDWTEEPVGVDWLLIGLAILALVAVLGLIPLWRTVYQHYRTPSPATSPDAYHYAWEELSAVLPDGTKDQAEGEVELDDSALVWYNNLPSRLSSVRSAFQSNALKRTLEQSGRSPGLGVNLTGFKGKV